MLKDDELIGAIAIYRQEVRPFTDKQIELVQNFAAQAVIAIENTRLLNELREDLTLQQQTATSEVLKVISSSPGELDPVFGAMLAESTELCEASYATLWLREGDGFRATALHGDLPPAWVEQWRSKALYRPPPNRPIARIIEAQAPVQIADMRDDPSYLEGDPLPVAAVEIAGIRTLLGVPMIKEDELVGVIVIYRQEVRPFTDKQIELVQNFAAQAVIAIENTRLLNELRELSLQQQTATVRGAEGHLQFAGRPGAGLSGHAGERYAHLRSAVRHPVPLSTRAAAFGAAHCITRRPKSEFSRHRAPFRLAGQVGPRQSPAATTRPWHRSPTSGQSRARYVTPDARDGIGPRFARS